RVHGVDARARARSGAPPRRHPGDGVGGDAVGAVAFGVVVRGDRHVAADDPRGRRRGGGVGTRGDRLVGGSSMEPWLERAAAVWPDRVAVESAEGALTYAELLRRARGLPASPGDRVAILLPAGLEFAVALHACLLAGAVAMPVDLRLAEAERAARVREAGLVLDAPLAGRASSPVSARDSSPVSAGDSSPVSAGDSSRAAGARGVHVPDAGDPALVVHTSGTTGTPRAVSLSYG